MVYIISGSIIVLCVVIIIFGLRVFKENRQIKKELKERQNDDGDLRF
ncbi:MAG: hypothetical protein JNM88_09450 [Chitinophagaceae bacterium]|nr:hypothetical protein [Chitinophagaceae bacterium]